MNEAGEEKIRHFNAAKPFSQLVALIQSPDTVVVYAYLSKERLRLLQDYLCSQEVLLKLHLVALTEMDPEEKILLEEREFSPGEFFYFHGLKPGGLYCVELVAVPPPSRASLIIMDSLPIITPPDRNTLPAKNLPHLQLPGHLNAPALLNFSSRS